MMQKTIFATVLICFFCLFPLFADGLAHKSRYVDATVAALVEQHEERIVTATVAGSNLTGVYRPPFIRHMDAILNSLNPPSNSNTPGAVLIEPHVKKWLVCDLSEDDRKEADDNITSFCDERYRMVKILDSKVDSDDLKGYNINKKCLQKYATSGEPTSEERSIEYFILSHGNMGKKLDMELNKLTEKILTETKNKGINDLRSINVYLMACWAASQSEGEGSKWRAPMAQRLAKALWRSDHRNPKVRISVTAVPGSLSFGVSCLPTQSNIDFYTKEEKQKDGESQEEEEENKQEQQSNEQIQTDASYLYSDIYATYFGQPTRPDVRLPFARAQCGRAIPSDTRSNRRRTPRWRLDNDKQKVSIHMNEHSKFLEIHKDKANDAARAVMSYPIPNKIGASWRSCSK